MHLARQTWCAAGAMGCGDGLWRWVVPARCRASPAEDACVREEAVCTGGRGDGGGGDGGGGWR